jgi:large subunit ribosomal protein L17
MFSNMVVSLFEHERIQTTDAKAKQLRSRAERLITTAKKGHAATAQAGEAVDENDKRRLIARSLHLRRQAAKVVKDPGILQKLFDELAGRYADRPGGYTRIVKLGNRMGDAAPVSLIELVDNPFGPGSAPVLGDDDEFDTDDDDSDDHEGHDHD